MSTFKTPLAVTPVDGRRWRLVYQFCYGVGSKYSKEQITVPKDFVTDFASIPGWRLLFWWLPYWAKYSKAPVLHDWMYGSKVFDPSLTPPYRCYQGSREAADRIFLEAMLVDWAEHKTGPAIAWIEYRFVRLFGWLAWRKQCKIHSL